eukprot:366453-Chlamydomonas_euryale.AAC.18
MQHRAHHAACSAAARNMQRKTRITDHAAQNMQHTPCSIRHADRSMQRSAHSVPHAACRYHAPGGVHMVACSREGRCTANGRRGTCLGRCVRNAILVDAEHVLCSCQRHEADQVAALLIQPPTAQSNAVETRLDG